MALPNNTLPPLTEQAIQRFWKYVDKTPGQGPKGECWEWQARRLKKGHGVFVYSKRKHLKAHRVSFFLATKVDPAGLFVLHSCDNPPCCNPAHLRMGTAQDNVNDARDRNRMTVGSKHPRAILTESQVSRMRYLYSLAAQRYGKKRSRTRKKLIARFARIYGIAVRTVEHVIWDNRWQHVSHAPQPVTIPPAP